MTESDTVLRSSAIRSLQTTFEELRSNFLGGCNFFYYSSDDAMMTMPADYAMNIATFYGVKNRIGTYIREESERLVFSKKWTLLQASEEGTWFIVKIYQSQGHFLGAWIPVDTIEERFGVNWYSKENHYMSLVRSGECVTEVTEYEKVVGTKKLVVDNVKNKEICGSYEVSYYGFDAGDFSFIFLINIMEGYQNVQNLLTFLVCFLFFILGMGLWLLVYIQKNLLRPVNEFVNRLSLENSSMEYRPYFKEMALVDSMFRKARQEIKDLKISKYETELQRNRIEMDYLQQQIKPHFYLNCMNIIYSMAQAGHLEEIKKLSVGVSDYLRSIFRHADVPVTLEEELRHVENYLEINKIRYEGELETEIIIWEELKKQKIIPLLIHTLVENSIKHAMFSNSILKIKIEVIKENRAQENIYIRVSDNGHGFSEEALKILNGGDEMTTTDGKHVGLANTIRRLKFYYHGKAGISFSNLEAGGALAELWIPSGDTEETIIR